MRMAASCAQRTRGFTFLFIISLLHAGVVAEEIAARTASSPLESEARGDNVLKTTKAPGQRLVFPTVGITETTEQTTTAAAATQQWVHVQVQTKAPEITEGETPAPMPSRGDGPHNKPRSGDVTCVSKEPEQSKDAVSLKLKASSSCEDTKLKIESVLQELCGDDCKLEIYQEENSNQCLVSGKYVEDDVISMTDKFNNDNVKHKTDIKEAVLRWGKNSKLVLVSLLLTGLLLAALLVAGYYLKTHRKNSKGVRLAESFQVDEENQANTLVSVAPLPQEPMDKPTANGESAAENGTNPAPATNGHSQTQTQTQTPVVDTQM